MAFHDVRPSTRIVECYRFVLLKSPDRMLADLRKNEVSRARSCREKGCAAKTVVRVIATVS